MLTPTLYRMYFSDFCDIGFALSRYIGGGESAKAQWSCGG